MKIWKLFVIEVSREEAKKMFPEIGDDLKLELIDDIPEGEQFLFINKENFLTFVVASMFRQQAKLKHLNC